VGSGRAPYTDIEKLEEIKGLRAALNALEDEEFGTPAFTEPRPDGIVERPVVGKDEKITETPEQVAQRLNRTAVANDEKAAQSSREDS
jgi:hypothetical protein